MASSSMVPTTKMELHVAARGLKNMDTFSKSDPMCRLMMFKDGRWQEAGRTEVVKDSLNVDWATSFIVEYYFESTQKLRFEVFDIDNAATLTLDDDDHIGSAETSLADICCAPGQLMTKPLISRRGTKHGTLSIRAEEVSTNNDYCSFHLSCRNLDKKDFFGKSDPFLVLSRICEDGSWMSVFKTDPIMKTLDPNFPIFNIPVAKLCNGDYDRPLRMEVIDWNKSGDHESIGSIETSLRALLDRVAGGYAVNTPIELFDQEKKKKKPTCKPSGLLVVNNIIVVHEYSLMDYISGGTEISLCVAVDFTASNGDPSAPSSKHYLAPGSMNEYEKAIRSVGDVLSPYDSDQLFPAFGFGAMLPGAPSVSHCFALNGNPAASAVAGIDGVVAAYHQALRNVRLYGPTLFTPIINAVASIAAQDPTKYLILLLMTDGVVNDRDATVEAIIRASNLPMSIVIVGVGNEDFSDMEFLDSDDKLLTMNGKTASRDCVQFVPFAKFRNSHFSVLAQNVLAEIPTQFLQYMKARSIMPKPKPVAEFPPAVYSPQPAPSAPAFDPSAPPAYEDVAQPPHPLLASATTTQ